MGALFLNELRCFGNLQRHAAFAVGSAKTTKIAVSL